MFSYSHQRVPQTVLVSTEQIAVVHGSDMVWCGVLCCAVLCCAVLCDIRAMHGVFCKTEGAPSKLNFLVLGLDNQELQEIKGSKFASFADSTQLKDRLTARAY